MPSCTPLSSSALRCPAYSCTTRSGPIVRRRCATTGPSLAIGRPANARLARSPQRDRTGLRTLVESAHDVMGKPSQSITAPPVLQSIMPYQLTLSSRCTSAGWATHRVEIRPKVSVRLLASVGAARVAAIPAGESAASAEIVASHPPMWDLETERLDGFGLNDQLEFGCLHDRQLCGVSTRPT